MSLEQASNQMSVAVTNNLPVAPPAPEGDAWGSEGASSSDMLIPRIQLMHDISELVKKDKASAGQLISSTTGEVLADLGATVEILPIVTYKEWIINDIEEKNGKRREKFRQIIPMTAANEGLPLEEVEFGKPISRVKSLNFLCLVTSKLDELPFLLAFRKSSYFGGKKLSTHFQMSAMKKQPPASRTFRLGQTEKTYDGFTFFVLTVEPGRPTTPGELKIARQWYDVFKQQGVKVADEAEIVDTDVPQF